MTPACAASCHALSSLGLRGGPCSLQGGWNYLAFTKWFCFSMEHTLQLYHFWQVIVHVADCPLCTDSSCYTKLIKWVSPVRKMTLFCSWVTFVWSLLIPLPRSRDILSKKAWKHLTDITLQRVCLYSACWHFLIPRNSFCMMQAQGSSPLPMQLLWLSAQIKWVCVQMASQQRLPAPAWILICSAESHANTNTNVFVY